MRGVYRPLFYENMDMTVVTQLREGDALTVSGKSRGDHGVTLNWHNRYLGTAQLPPSSAMRLLTPNDLVVRVIRLGFSLRMDRGRMVAALYQRPAHAGP